MKFSIQSLIKILLLNRHKFIIEPSDPKDKKCTVLSFKVGYEYPVEGPIIHNSQYPHQESNFSYSGGKLLLKYDSTNQMVVSSIYPIYMLLKDYKHEVQNTK